MKIGIVLYPTFGGSGVVATELGKSLAKQGHEIHFISYDLPVRLDALSERLHYHEVSVSDYPLFDHTPYELVLTSKLIEVVKYEKLDLLHVHYAIPHASAAYLAKKILSDEGIYIPYITTLHGTDITLVGKDKSFEPVITFAINHSDAVTAVSESLRSDTYDLFNVSNGIDVVPNFVDLDFYKGIDCGGLRERYAPNGEKLLTHVSNFRKVKRVEDIVKTFFNVQKELPSRLLLVGDGPERSNIEEMCREEGLCDSIVFLGKLKDPQVILKISDLFLLASEHESFGLSALEAMACGVPVISTDTGGLPEVNKNGYSGFTLPLGDVSGMTSRALEIISNEETHSQFKAQALEQAKKFSLDKVLPQYLEIYKRVIKDQRTRVTSPV
ncbi:MAG: N-acetyl-alpha-D-glucosaminyl L-malate synthase BshA [Flavobacteriales bacterium]|nr:N-acetyl-alpha-D-glucosaminyl L-malate synthase BshA [Flavobacteriales bacterium]